MASIRPVGWFLCCALLVFAPWARGADPAFVGVLALLSEDETADKVGLSSETRTQLQALIDAREEAVGALVLEIKNLSAEEKAAKLKPFVAESERRGLALLTAEQKKKLEQIRIAKVGTAVLLDPAIAGQIGLTPEQLTKLAELADKLKTESAPAAERERMQIRAKYEREMVAVLDKTQRAAWENLSGVGGDEVAAADPKSEPKPAPDDPFPGEGTPDKTTPEVKPEPKPEVKPTPMTPNVAKPEIKPAPTKPTKPAGPIDRENVRLKFNFQFAPWKTVLEWFAEQADYSLVGENIPTGTFNYKDNRSYTAAEAMDLLNGILLTKGHTLVLRGRMLLVVNLEDGIPSTLVRDVQPEQLKSLGEYELVRCLFTLDKMAPEDAESEVKKMLGPQGSLTVLPKSRQIYVTETGAKLRSIQRVIDAVENPAVPRDEKVVSITLKHVTPAEFLKLVRPLLGIPDNTFALPDQSLRFSVDETGGRLLVTGKPERLEWLQGIVQELDLDAGKPEEPAAPIEAPQLEVYTVAPADPAATLQIFQTLLAGNPNVRLTTDAKTGNLVALAPPTVHATIRETLTQLTRGDGRQTEVFPLKKLDPQAAVLAINKLFGGEEGKEGGGPKIDADPTTMRLMIRGTKTQIAQIRDLLMQLGEVGGTVATSEEPVERSMTRFIPLTGRAQDSALDQVQQLWPTVRPQNRIRAVMPSRLREGEEIERRRPAEIPPALKDAPKNPPDSEREARRAASGGVRAVFVSEKLTAQLPAAQEPAPALPAESEPEKKPKRVSKPGAEIVITRGPKGIVIASEDLDALDDLERLFASVAESTARTGREFTIFYLKYSKVDSAAELLKEAMGAAPIAQEGGGGGGLLGDLAGGLLGDSGGLLGSLLGGGGGGGSSSSSSSASSGAPTIIPDVRLNALLVSASPTELDMMEQLLKVIDQPSSPENVETIARPRLIPVLHTKADEIAVLVRQVYAGRISAEGSGQQRQPSPEDLVRALRGGRGGAQQPKKAEEQKITIGVDMRTNSLAVSAPEYLFNEIKDFVARVDTPVANSEETVRVVPIKRSSPELIQRTISSVLGPEQVKTSATVAGGAGRGSGGTQPQSGSANLSGRQSGGTRGGQQQQSGNNQGGGDILRQLQQLQQGLNGGGGGRGGGGFGGGAPSGGFGGGGFGGGRGGR